MTTMFNYNGRNYAQNEKGNRFYMQGDDSLSKLLTAPSDVNLR